MGVCCTSKNSNSVVIGNSVVGTSVFDYDDSKPKDRSNFRSSIFLENKQYSKICDEYKLLDYIGKGACGIIQKVQHLVTGGLRAMKIISKSNFIDIGDETRLNKEVEILKRLNHPNILKVYDFYIDSRNYYIVTEYCRGGELFDKITEFGLFSEKTAAIIMKQILQGVAYCHNKGIAHRDLKPENILIESQGYKDDIAIKIIDFGASIKFKSKQLLTDKIGTVSTLRFNLFSLIMLLLR